MNVITLKPHRYKNVQKSIGEKYDFVGRAERRLAIALGWIERTYDDMKIVEIFDVEALPVKGEEEPIEVPEVEDVQAEAKEEPAETTIHLKRTYKRRDMVAE